MPRLSDLVSPHPLVTFLRQHGVSTVLIEYGTVAAPIVAPLKRAGIRVFVHFHAYDATRHSILRRYAQDYAVLFAQADGFFAPSRYIAERIIALGLHRDKVTVCPCGVDPDVFSISDRTPKRLLAVGRLRDKKAPLVTLQAFAIAAAQDPDLHLDMIGDGPLFDEAATFIRDKGLEGRAVLHGALPHSVVPRFFQQAQAFLQHSVEAADGDMEGLPVAVLEAMASAIPVISTRHSGIPEAVIDGDTGFLTDEHDVEGMADAILRVTAMTPEDVAAMGNRARAHLMAHFTAQQSLTVLRVAMGLD